MSVSSHHAGVETVITVKPETDETHLRLRAWHCARLHRSLGKPLRQEDTSLLIINGGKGRIVVHTIFPEAPTAA